MLKYQERVNEAGSLAKDNKILNNSLASINGVLSKQSYKKCFGTGDIILLGEG